jgi:hypothetical protein
MMELTETKKDVERTKETITINLSEFVNAIFEADAQRFKEYLLDKISRNQAES